MMPPMIRGIDPVYLTIGCAADSKRRRRAWAAPAAALHRLAASVILRSRLLRQRRGVPDDDRAVVRAASQAVAVRAKRHAPDRTLEGEEFLAGLGIPYLQRTFIRRRIARTASQPFAVRAEVHVVAP